MADRPTAGPVADRPVAGPDPSQRTARTKRARVSPDRERVSTMRLWAMTLLSAAMVWSALSSLSTGQSSRLSSTQIGQASGIVAALAIFGLRSIPVRWIVRCLALLTGLMLARFGQLGTSDGLTGSWRVLVWLATLGIALTLAPSSRSVVVEDARQNGRGHDRQTGRAMSIASETRGRIPAAIAIAAVSFLAGAALIVGPRASNWFPTGARASDLIDHSRNRTDNVLVSRDSLDMTARPRLSDTVVMTVRSPLVTFWRAELFDRWDGTRWTRSYERAGGLLPTGRVDAPPDDIAAQRGTETTQQFRLEGGYATVMPSAASPVQVTSDNEVAQRADGTLVSAYQPLGAGSTYTIKSRQMSLDAGVLRSAGSAKAAARNDPVAARVLEQYAADPVATARVVRVARDQTASATTDFDRILALERFMATNNTYSLDAPLSPAGVDVVDHFLFEEREGWCEQIASALVVMARSLDIPARLATGYAPGEWDSAGSRFIVRERDAHAWAEVWFPGQGWVAFDPTANVPLSGTADATAGAAARDWREIAGVLLLAVGFVSIGAAPAARLLSRALAALRSRRSRQKLASEHWEVRAARRLEQLGDSLGEPRSPSESLTHYGGSVTRRCGDGRFVEVGAALDHAMFSRPVPDGDPARTSSPARERVEQLLDELENV